MARLNYDDAIIKGNNNKILTRTKNYTHYNLQWPCVFMGPLFCIYGLDVIHGQYQDLQSTYARPRTTFPLSIAILVTSPCDVIIAALVGCLLHVRPLGTWHYSFSPLMLATV